MSEEVAMSEVAMFIDFENLRYGLLNNYGEEPDITKLVEKAKKYGRPSMMKAYADFSEHPVESQRQLHLAGIEVINVLAKRRIVTHDNKEVERVKNAADMFMALDAIIEGWQADSGSKKKVFLIVTGDRDFVKLVTHLRNIFGQRVVVVGVPGSVARDLEIAAGEFDHIEIAETAPADMTKVKRAIVAMVKKGPAPLTYWSLKIIDQWSNDARHSIPGKAVERRIAIGELVKEGVLTTRLLDRGTKGKATETVLQEQKAQEVGYLS